MSVNLFIKLMSALSAAASTSVVLISLGSSGIDISGIASFSDCEREQLLAVPIPLINIPLKGIAD